MESIILIVVVAVVFFLLRELWTWYWKINKIVKTLDNVTWLLEKILAEIKIQSPKDPEVESKIKTVEDKVSKLHLQNKETGNVKIFSLEDYNSWDNDEKDKWEIVD